MPASVISMSQQCDIISISLITGNSLVAGKCLTETRLRANNIYRQITAINAQLISKAGFLKERIRKRELGLKIVNFR